MTSEWEELEKLSKEELIIEIVKERTAHRELDRSVRGLMEIDHPVDRRLPVFVDEDDESLSRTTDEWAYRVARYAYEHWEHSYRFIDLDLREYGLYGDQAEDAYRRLCADGIIPGDGDDGQE